MFPVADAPAVAPHDAGIVGAGFGGPLEEPPPHPASAAAAASDTAIVGTFVIMSLNCARFGISWETGLPTAGLRARASYGKNERRSMAARIAAENVLNSSGSYFASLV